MTPHQLQDYIQNAPTIELQNLIILLQDEVEGRG